MEAYIVPDWLTIIAGLVIYQRQPELKVLLGLRSARVEAGKWCLPTGLGAIRRDTSSALAEAIRKDISADFSKSLKDPMAVIQSMSERHQLAFLTPGGFALAETKWYVETPMVVEQLIPLKPICQLDNKSLLVKIYFGLEWYAVWPPMPAETEWPFTKVQFFSREELKHIPIAFGCDKDLDAAFWP